MTPQGVDVPLQLVEGLSQSFLDQIPSLEPPPGVTSNLTNPNDKGPAVAAVVSVFAGLALSLTLVRIYSKCFLLRKASIDDQLTVSLALGLGTGLAFFVGVVRGDIQGPYGIHQWDVSVGTILSKSQMIIPSWLSTFSSLALGFIKLTIFLFQYQLFWPLRWLRICVYLGAPLATAFYISIAIVHFSFVTPSHNETWLSHILGSRELKSRSIDIPVGCVGLAVDVYLFILPMVAVYQLQMQRKQKRNLLIMFSFGLLAVACSAVSVYYRVRAEATKNTTGLSVFAELMCMIEIYVGVTIACLPSLAKVLRETKWPSMAKVRARLQSRLRQANLRFLTRAHPATAQSLPVPDESAQQPQNAVEASN